MSDQTEARRVTVHLEHVEAHPFTDGMVCDWCHEREHPEALAVWMGEQCIGIYCAECEPKARRMVAIASEEARDALTP